MKSSGCFSLMDLSSFSRAENWGVKPHFEAVFTTRITLPFRLARGNAVPFSVEKRLVEVFWKSIGGKGRTVDWLEVVECSCG